MSLYTTTRLEDLIDIRDEVDRLIDRVKKRDIQVEETRLVRFFCGIGDSPLVKLYEEELTLNQRDRVIGVVRGVFRGMMTWP